MLKSVRFSNFKALQDVSLGLERLTVLVGANGCGKTSVLEAIDLACKLREPIVQEERYPFHRAGLVFTDKHAPKRLRTARSNDAICIELAHPHDFQISISQAPIAPHYDHWRLTNRYGSILLGHGLAADPTAIASFFQSAEEILPRAERMTLRAELLAAPSFVEPGHPATLAPDGTGLASMLAYLAGKRSRAIDRIEADLRTIVPRVESLQIEGETITRDEVEYVQLNGQALPRHTPRAYSGHRLELRMRGAGFLRAEAISEGTLLALGMLTVLHADDAPSLVLFDDIDRGLHPVAQRAVFNCLRQILDARPDLQIVCTTHSPYALDCVRPEEVRVLKLDGAGHTHVRALTDHPEWPQWKDHLAPGEFWSAYGEDWVYGDVDAG